MSVSDPYLILFVITAFLFQAVLIIHFALRKWKFATALRYGPAVYALSLPCAMISVILLRGGVGLSFWLAGFLYLIWAAYGYSVEYVQKIQWRTPMRWSIGGPYITLYLATVMFYWWPLAQIYPPLWYLYAALFLTSTYLNVTSHHGIELTYKEIR